MVLEEIPAEVGRVGLVGSVGGLAAFLLYSRCLRRFPSSHDIPCSSPLFLPFLFLILILSSSSLSFHRLGLSPSSDDEQHHTLRARSS